MKTNDSRSLLSARPIFSVYFLIWSSCVIKERSASYLGQWTAVRSGSLSQARQLFPPVLGFNPTVSKAQAQVPLVFLLLPPLSVGLPLEDLCSRQPAGRSDGSEPAVVRWLKRHRREEERKGVERDLTLISCQCRFNGFANVASTVFTHVHGQCCHAKTWRCNCCSAAPAVQLLLNCI